MLVASSRPTGEKERDTKKQRKQRERDCRGRVSLRMCEHGGGFVKGWTWQGGGGWSVN